MQVLVYARTDDLSEQAIVHCVLVSMSYVFYKLRLSFKLQKFQVSSFLLQVENCRLCFLSQYFQLHMAPRIISRQMMAY